MHGSNQSRHFGTKPKFKLIIPLALLLMAYTAGTAIIYTDKLKLYLILGFSILMMIPYIVRKIGLFPLFCGLIFMYWIPLSSGLTRLSSSLSGVYLTEFGVWMLCFGILIHRSVSLSAQWNSTIKRFPSLPFLLFISGALITYSISENFYYYSELARIRVLYLLPAFLCFLCMYIIKSRKQAEYMLWSFLISSTILCLVYLYGPQITPLEILFERALDVQKTGRIARIIKLPIFGPLHMNPETTSICFAFIMALSFTLWLTHPSLKKRLVAAVISAISGWAIIKSQGRTGLIAAGCSILVIMILTLKLKKYSFIFSKSLFKAGMIILLLFGGFRYLASISTIETLQQHTMLLFTDPLYALADRIYRWKVSVGVLLDNPLGVGIYGFPGGMLSWYPHNLYLYLLLSSGIIGFIGFSWIFVHYTKVCCSGLYSNNLNSRILCIGGIGCVTVLFVGGMTSCIYWEYWEILMVWIPIGITMAAATLKDEEKTKKVGGIKL